MRYRFSKIHLWSQPMGFTLIELVVASASAAILMAGLFSALYIGSQSLEVASGPLVTTRNANTALTIINRDLQSALSFSELTATAITMTVPDRDGDNTPEIIRYAWSGQPGDPVTQQYNDRDATPFVQNARSLSFTWLTRLIEGAPVEMDGIRYHEFTEQNNLAALGANTTIDSPSGTQEGDLLIAAVAVDGFAANLSPPAGWNQILNDVGNFGMRLGVWWKIAGPNESSNSYQFTWDSFAGSYGWIMRFSGHHPTAPIHTSSTAQGSSANPPSPSLTTTVDNCLILRLGGFDGDQVTPGDTGIAGATTITMNASQAPSNRVSGGAAWSLQLEAGSVGSSSFVLNASDQYRTLTIAIAPDPNP